MVVARRLPGALLAERGHVVGLRLVRGCAEGGDADAVAVAHGGGGGHADQQQQQKEEQKRKKSNVIHWQARRRAEKRVGSAGGGSHKQTIYEPDTYVQLGGRPHAKVYIE